MSLTPANCSDVTTIHVNVPYYPYTYCYSGIGSRFVGLTQVYSIESRGWTVTILWKPPCCPAGQSSLTPYQTLFTQNGYVDTISVP